MEKFEQYDGNQKDKSSILIKIILPVISILIVLTGLIVLYQVGNVDQYVTNEMRIGFGYALSLGLLGGYLFEKVRSTVFSQIVLSGTLSALTLTTIIATHGYKIFPHFMGLGILGVLFFIGLFLAKEHTSEIEFSTSALIGLSIPFFYSLDSFFVILLLEIIVVGALYLFLAFFKRVRFLHIVVLLLHVILAIIIVVQYISVFAMMNKGYNWTLNLYEILQLSLLWIPFFYLRRKFFSIETFQIVVILITIFCMVLSVRFVFLQVHDETAVRLHFGIVYAIIASFLIVQAFVLRDEENSQLLHILSFVALTLGSFLFFKVFMFKLAAILTITFLHTWLLNSVFETEDEDNKWNKFLNIVFGGIGVVLALSLVVNIMSFVLRVPIVETSAFHERFIPPTVLVLNYWLAHLFIVDKRTFSFQKGFVFSLAWIFTALYFLYIPWQFMQLALNGSPTIQLILLSVLWGTAAYIATIVGMKAGRIGLRIFTLIIVVFLLVKYALVDVSVFWECNQVFALSFYTIFFGIALLILSALMIKEITKNGSLKTEWLELKQAFIIKRKKPKTTVSPMMSYPNIGTESTACQYHDFPNVNQTASTTTPIMPVPEVVPFINNEPATVVETAEMSQQDPIIQEEPSIEVVPVVEAYIQEEVGSTSIVTDNMQIQIAQLIALLEEQGRFNENHIKVQEMQFEIQQMYIDSQKKMNEQINEMLENLRSLGNNKEAN